MNVTYCLSVLNGTDAVRHHVLTSSCPLVAGWLHHHELTEEMVHTLDEKLDVLKDDLMTCMTTEDDQDLDNKVGRTSGDRTGWETEPQTETSARGIIGLG